jgi:hypothetical protein
VPKDFCLGDPGSALVQLGNSGLPQDDLVMGVLSWGSKCADPNFPGVSARTSAGADWIRSQTCLWAGALDLDLDLDVDMELAPAYLNCSLLDLDIPTTTMPPPGTIPVLLCIVMDSHAKDISWELIDLTTALSESHTRGDEIIQQVEPETHIPDGR